MRSLGFVRVAPAADALSTAGDEGFANASLAAVCPRGGEGGGWVGGVGVGCVLLASLGFAP